MKIDPQILGGIGAVSTLLIGIAAVFGELRKDGKLKPWGYITICALLCAAVVQIWAKWLDSVGASEKHTEIVRKVEDESEKLITNLDEIEKKSIKAIEAIKAIENLAIRRLDSLTKQANEHRDVLAKSHSDSLNRLSKQTEVDSQVLSGQLESVRGRIKKLSEETGEVGEDLSKVSADVKTVWENTESASKNLDRMEKEIKAVTDSIAALRFVDVMRSIPLYRSQTPEELKGTGISVKLRNVGKRDTYDLTVYHTGTGEEICEKKNIRPGQPLLVDDVRDGVTYRISASDLKPHRDEKKENVMLYVQKRQAIK